MTKQEQIDEIAKITANTWLVDLEGDTKDVCEVLDEADIQSIARELYGKGCRIISKDAVLLTKEELDKLHIFDDEMFERILNYEREKGRKETAKEILNMGKKLYEMSYHKSNAMPRLIEWIKAEYGVEVEE